MTHACLIWATGTAGPSPARWRPCRPLLSSDVRHPGADHRSTDPPNHLNSRRSPSIRSTKRSHPWSRTSLRTDIPRTAPDTPDGTRLSTKQQNHSMISNHSETYAPAAPASFAIGSDASQIAPGREDCAGAVPPSHTILFSMVRTERIDDRVLARSTDRPFYPGNSIHVTIASAEVAILQVLARLRDSA